MTNKKIDMNKLSDASEKIWRPSAHVVMRRIAGETILVPVSGNLANMQRLFTLNEMGALVWAMMEGGNTVGDIKEAIAGEFEVEQIRSESDLMEFIDQLAGSGLIQEQIA
jgi:hypothetical protein